MVENGLGIANEGGWRRMVYEWLRMENGLVVSKKRRMVENGLAVSKEGEWMKMVETAELYINAGSNKKVYLQVLSRVHDPGI